MDTSSIIARKTSILKLRTRETALRGKTAEQKARNMLKRIGIKDVQSFSSGDLVELANLIAEVEELRNTVTDLECSVDQMRE